MRMAPMRGAILAGKVITVALTDIAIRNAKPRPKPYKLADSLGLFLLVQPSNSLALFSDMLSPQPDWRLIPHATCAAH